MEDISQLILDLAQNSIAAKADKIDIIIKCNYTLNRLEINIIDNGSGMDLQQLNECTNPFYTTRKTRSVGLGLPIAKMLAEQSGGDFSVESYRNEGTTLKFWFKLNHWDRPPMGKLEETYLALIILNPSCNITLTLQFEEHFVISSKEIKENIGDSEISEGWVVDWLKDYLKENIYHLVKEELL